VLSCGLVGLGFETKMGVALMVVPAIAAAWFWFAPQGRLRATGQLLAGGAAMAVAGLAWPVAVALTPVSDRPWVSGTSDNSIWSLIFGYNGLGRLDGQMGGPGGGAGPGGGPGGNAGPFGGSAGPFRLFNEALGGQAGWLLGFAVVSIVAVAVATRMKRSDRRAAWVIALGGSFAITAVAFSFAQGIFHPYYVSLLAPFTAALVGAGFGLAISGERGTRVLAPLAVMAGALTELAVLGSTSGGLGWLKPFLFAVAILAALALVNPLTGRVRSTALATALAVLLIAPAAWSFQTLGHATSSTFPAGGPATASGFGGPGGGAMRGGPPPTMGNGASTTGPSAGPMGGGAFGGNQSSVSAAVAYAKAHGGGVVAVSSQSGASASIIRSGSNVVAIGGFSGRESQVSIEWFAKEVAAGKIRWVVADSGGGMPSDGRVGSKDVMSAVAQTCKAITTSGGTIYDCQGYAGALSRI
jgi:4-amino-4-deoxy-L-arabinose transferase-like glycosyltransferase